MEYQTDTMTLPAEGTETPCDAPALNGHTAGAPADIEAMKERYWELTFRLYHHTEQPGDKAERSDLNRRIEAVTLASGAGKTTSEYVAWQIEKEIEDHLKVEEA